MLDALQGIPPKNVNKFIKLSLSLKVIESRNYILLIERRGMKSGETMSAVC